jgi:enterochelin esterase family protein
MRGRVDITRHTSRLLEGNALGDPIERDVIVYLPEAYDDGGRYPVVMVLPGFGSTHRNLVSFDLWRPNLVQLFDGLVARRESPPAILVLPDASTRLGGSQFLDSTSTGRYQSYLVDEVLPLVDATYRTIPTREARAVLGRSSGGFGALRLGMDRPEAFSVLGSHAGDAAFETSLRPMFASAALAYERAGGVAAFLEGVTAKGPKGSDFDPLFFLAAAAAYAPDPNAPFPHVRLPFDPRTAEIDHEAWARYLEHDPVCRIPAAGDALRGMHAIFVDAGNGDEYGLQFASRQVVAALRAVGADVRYEEFEGGHRGTSHRYAVSLPVAVRALARER